MLVLVMLHQIPLSPKAVCVRTSARGILDAVNMMLTIEGGTVFPYPEKAPAVVISTLMNNWETPSMIR